MPEVTIAIPCYNGEKYLRGVLEAVFSQSYHPLEVLVVDDGSMDGSVELARSYPVRLIKHTENRGLAIARNSALKNARGEIIIFLDVDTIPSVDVIERVIFNLRNPGIMGVGGQETESVQRTVWDLWRFNFWRQTHGEEFLKDSLMLIGLCCAYRKSVLMKVGGFDERFVSHGEDVDLGLRLRREGYRLSYDPRIAVKHMRSDSFYRLAKMVYLHSLWQLYAVKLNGGEWREYIARSVRWLFITTGSSLKTHKNLKLMMISPIICLIGLAGSLAGIIRR